MAKTGNISEDCQRTAVLNALGELNSVINGIQSSDMKPQLRTQLTEKEIDWQVEPFDADVARDQFYTLSQLVDAWKVRIKEMSSETIVDKSLFIGDENDAIGVFGFTKKHSLDEASLIEELQDILFDEIGSSGHFRLLPAQKDMLTPNFVMGATPTGGKVDFLPFSDNEIRIAFLKSNGEGLPLTDEIEIFNQELSEFCLNEGYTVTQLNIDTVYE
jgi:hypothetical protein